MDTSNLIANNQFSGANEPYGFMAASYNGGGAPGPYPPGAAAGPYPPGAAAGPYPPGAAAGPYAQGAAAGAYQGNYPQGAAAGAYQGNYPQGAAAGANQGPVPPMQGGPPPGDASSEKEPSAPPIESMEQHPGYENIGFEGASAPLPSYESAMAGSPPPQREEIKVVASITETEAREALMNFVSEHCCYGKKPSVEMLINNLTSTNAFHYTLETFGESRSTKWTYQPYRGEGLIITASPPGPWDIQAQPSQLFCSSKLEVEVPNTANVKPCFSCNATGYKRCFLCMGTGRRLCSSCNGTGHRRDFENGRHHHRHCPFCSGGYSSCSNCGGMGRNMCYKCQGRGNLRWFILLTITWTNHLEDYVLMRTSLPNELIRDVSGKVAFEETNPRVWPVNHFPEQEINTASNNLVNKHSNQFPAERILMQRQRVRIIPVTQVFYQYKVKHSSYFVYGFENKVYAPDYPEKCCCGCSIL